MFCLTNVVEEGTGIQGIDLDGNGYIGDANYELLGGIGVCEDSIFCPQLVDCACGRMLTMTQCMELLCDYWEKQHLDATSELREFFRPGSCYPLLNQSERQNHWYDIYGGGEELTCLSLQPKKACSVDSDCNLGQVCKQGLCVYNRLTLMADSPAPPSQAGLTVTVEVETFTSLSGIQFALDYDEYHLTYSAGQVGSFFDDCPIVNDDGDKVSVACIAYGTDGVVGGGDIISIDFKTDSAGQAAFKLVEVTGADAMNQKAMLVTEQLWVTIR
jgi:hypothetical protein